MAEIPYTDELGERWVLQSRTVNHKGQCSQCGPSYMLIRNCVTGVLVCFDHFEFLGYDHKVPSQYNIRRKF